MYYALVNQYGVVFHRVGTLTSGKPERVWPAICGGSNEDFRLYVWSGSIEVAVTFDSPAGAANASEVEAQNATQHQREIQRTTQETDASAREGKRRADEARAAQQQRADQAQRSALQSESRVLSAEIKSLTAEVDALEKEIREMGDISSQRYGNGVLAAGDRRRALESVVSAKRQVIDMKLGRLHEINK